MNWFLHRLLVPLSVLSLGVGWSVANPPLGLTPVVESAGFVSQQLPDFESLDELYALRDRLRAELKSRGTLNASTTSSFFIPPVRLPLLQTLEIRIQVEETAQANWQFALKLANAALELEQTADASPELLGDIYALWREAIASLNEIPEQSLLAQTAADKLKEYQLSLQQAADRYDAAQSNFLEAIAQGTGLPPSQVHITVCSLNGNCRKLNGDLAPENPASLIKVPVAVALMEKVQQGNISLETKIEVTSNNYTEDGSDVWVGEKYTLRHLVTRMINQSSNIATNQLIDYLGMDYINQVMRDRGYGATEVNTKLVGEYIYPDDAGDAPNRLTTDDLTAMVRQIYRQERQGDGKLLDALISQEDTVLGYEALKNLSAIWMGEKTGQNSQVLGTTLAMSIQGEFYVMSIVLDHSSDEIALRECIRSVAQHIAQRGKL